ncbi:hypothetical protein [Curtobacterium sp. TXMA1]|uniref:DNA modification methylase n=1 Tax=Curtobacterium oceanosedimentum TaxID=465820 RepID=A0A147DN66_9MICO|nr:hypothetical protein [Curtobacterium sp. TXMA1]KTR49153.1 hypothetical protein NS359_14260 [Curtobacterium oceanosedimentum]UBQ02195.1 hypothetical protein LCG91_14240 [Curtobacterium sp. TXMA1]
MSVAVAASIALGATGCEFMSPAHTTEIKQITDGVNVSTGSIDIRNALFISDQEDDARFVGTIVNTGSEDVTLSIEVGGDTQTVVVPGNGRADLGSNDPSASRNSGGDSADGNTGQGSEVADPKAVLFDASDVVPGSLVKTYFSYSGAEGVSASVPVLTSALEEYQTLAPSTSPSATPSMRSTSPSESGSEPTGDATAPGTQSGDSQTDSSEGDSGSN